MKFMSREEMAELEHFYPEPLRTEFWEMREKGQFGYDAFRLRNVAGEAEYGRADK